MAAKKVVPLLAKKKPEPQPEPNPLDAFRNRTSDICRHITSYGETESRGDLYEATTLLLTHIGALFSAIAALNENEEETHSLCMLGEDLAAEVSRRVNHL
jgi:hypothetical protein